MKLLYIRVIYGEPEKLPYGISVLNLENSHPPVNIHFLKKKKKKKKFRGGKKNKKKKNILILKRNPRCGTYLFLLSRRQGG